MAWKVWFDDNTTYDNTQGNIASVPNKGVVAVAVNAASGGPTVAKDADWYIYSAAMGFRGISLYELLRQLANSPGSFTLVRQGALVADAAYQTMTSAAATFAAG